MPSTRSRVALAMLLLASLGSTPARAQCPPELQAKVFAFGTGTDQIRFGHSVALDAAGKRAVVGVDAQNLSQPNDGAVFVFDFDGATWVEAAELRSVGLPVGELFGRDVDLNAAGDVVLIGAPFADGVAIDSGAAYVWEEHGGAWSQTAALHPWWGSKHDFIGWRVALSADGNVALVGAPEANGPALASGIVHVFARQGGGWSQQAVLMASDGLWTDEFGEGLAIDATGARALVGAPGHKRYLPSGPVQHDAGQVYVFERAGSTWTETAILAPARFNQGQQFGKRIDLVPGGHVAAIAGPGTLGNSGVYTGVVYLYGLVGGSWVETLRLEPSAGNWGDWFGSAVAISASGQRLLVGADLDDDMGLDAGAAYRIDIVGGAPAEVAKLLPPAVTTKAWFGYSVALDAEGATQWIGAPFDREKGPGKGAAYAFAGPYAQRYCEAAPNSQGCLPALEATGVPSASIGAGFVLHATQLLNQSIGIVVYSTTGPAQAPFGSGTLCVAPPLVRLAPQLTGGNPPPADCSGTLALDFNVHVASGTDPQLSAGAGFWAQVWSRDPAAASGVSLTDAVTGVLCP